MNEVARIIYVALIREKEAELERTDEHRQTSQRDANEASHAMESRYDTFREESQYLAGAHAKRQRDMRAAVVGLRTRLNESHATDKCVVLGSIVSLENTESGAVQNYILVPDGAGGSTFPQDDGTEIKAIAITTPIARQLVRKELSDVVTIGTPKEKAEWEIKEIK